MNTNRQPLQAIITGATKGLGLELCRQLLNKGFQVIGFARSAAHSSLQPYIDKGKYKHVVADLADLQNIERVFLEAADNKMELIIINAADFSVSDEPAIVQQQLNLNMMFPVLFIQKFLSFGVDFQPKIVFVSSIMAYIPDSKNPAYGAAKAGVTHYINGVGLRGKVQADFLQVIAGRMEHSIDNRSILTKFTSTSFSKAAAAIIEGADAGEKIIFVPGIWKYIIYLLHVLGKNRVSRLINNRRQ